jgi:hypothetical protein
MTEVMGRRNVVALVVAAAAFVGVAGCGFVEDDPAGSAAPNDREVVIPTVTTVPAPTLPDSAPSQAAADRPSDPMPSPGPQSNTTLPTLSEADLRVIARCEAIRRFQKAGVEVVLVSVNQPAELVSAIRQFQSEADQMLNELEPDLRAQVEPAVNVVRVAIPGVELRSPAELIAEWNGIVGSSESLWSQALRALSVSCPPVVPPDTVDQAAVFRLGAELPPGFEQALDF